MPEVIATRERGENEESRGGEPLRHLDSLLYLQRPHDPRHDHAHEDVEARPCPSSDHMHVVEKEEAPRREGGYEDDGRDHAYCESPCEEPARVGRHPRGVQALRDEFLFEPRCYSPKLPSPFAVKAKTSPEIAYAGVPVATHNPP